MAGGAVTFYEGSLQFPAPAGWHEILAVIALMGLVTGAGFSGVLSLAVARTDSATAAVTWATLFAATVEVALVSPLAVAYASSGGYGWPRLAAATVVTITLAALLARASLRQDARTR